MYTRVCVNESSGRRSRIIPWNFRVVPSSEIWIDYNLFIIVLHYLPLRPVQSTDFCGYDPIDRDLKFAFLFLLNKTPTTWNILTEHSIDFNVVQFAVRNWHGFLAPVPFHSLHLYTSFAFFQVLKMYSRCNNDSAVGIGGHYTREHLSHRTVTILNIHF